MTMTYGQIESSLQAAVLASVPEDDDNDNWVYVLDFSDSFVVYQSNGEYLQDDYTIDDAGEVTLAGSPEAVKSVTSYVPVEQDSAPGAIDRRGNQGPAGIGPVRGGLSTLQAAPIRVLSEPLTYHQHARESYFRDLLLTGRIAGAANRLQRHAQEMDVVSKEREQSALRSIRSGGFEYRVEPNRTDGQGGFFSPPLWLNELFATAKRPGRVLASLIPGRFPLPPGASSINLPIIQQGTVVQPTSDSQAVPDQDITDAAGTSTVVALAGQADVALPLLEQSPAGAHLDQVIYLDMAEAYDADLESQLLAGLGAAFNQLLGVINASSVTVSYTDATPTGSEMYPFLGQTAAQLADGRSLPLEAWLMRSARWAWLTTQESTQGLPFGLPSPFFMGDTDTTPDPVGGLSGWPVFPDDAIPANLGVGANQDVVVALRPTDLILLEGQPQTAVMREPGSGNLEARIQLRNYAASITNRYSAGIAVLGGTGFIVQPGF